MDNRYLANQLLAAFGKMLTVDGLQLGDEDNSCVLLFDGELALNIEYDEPAERLVFSIYIDRLPSEGAEPLARELLAANLYWIGAGGATLCLESATGTILMIYASRVAELDDIRFERIVENMLDMAERWRERVTAHRTGSAQAAETSAAPSAADIGTLPGAQPFYG